jgi:hypothetical protein
MSEEAVVGKTISFVRTGGTHRAHNGLARTVCAVVETITIVMSVCRCSCSMSDVVDAVADVMSPCSRTVRGCVSILVDDVAAAACWRGCSVDEDHVAVDLGDDASTMKQQSWCSASLQGVPRDDVCRCLAVGDSEKSLKFHTGLRVVDSLLMDVLDQDFNL